MNTIKMKIWDVIAFRLLFIFEFIFILIIGICSILTKQFLDIPTYIFGGLILLCVVVQLILLTGKNYIEFSKDEINIFFNKKVYKFPWKDISNPIYYSFGDIIILSQNTLDLKIRDAGGFVYFSRKFDGKQIYCNKKQYTQFYELFILSKHKSIKE